jgi:hypothetical protein
MNSAYFIHLAQNTSNALAAAHAALDCALTAAYAAHDAAKAAINPEALAIALARREAGNDSYHSALVAEAEKALAAADAAFSAAHAAAYAALDCALTAAYAAHDAAYAAHDAARDAAQP